MACVVILFIKMYIICDANDYYCKKCLLNELESLLDMLGLRVPQLTTEIFQDFLKCIQDFIYLTRMFFFQIHLEINK